MKQHRSIRTATTRFLFAGGLVNADYDGDGGHYSGQTLHYSATRSLPKDHCNRGWTS